MFDTKTTRTHQMRLALLNAQDADDFALAVLQTWSLFVMSATAVAVGADAEMQARKDFRKFTAEVFEFDGPDGIALRLAIAAAHGEFILAHQAREEWDGIN